MYVGLGQPGVTHKAVAYDAAGYVWNGSAFVAWSTPAYAGYLIAATEGSPGRYYATLPDGYARWELIEGPTFTAAGHADAVVYEGEAEAASEGVGSTVVVAPIVAQASGGDPRLPFRKVASQGSAPALAFTVVDATGAPVDLSGKTVRFVAATFDGRSYTTVFTRETGGQGVTIGGDDDNVASVALTTSNTATAASLHAWLWDITSNLVLATGTLEVPAARKV